MADINTLLGLGLTEQDDMQALANQLRGQQREGQFLGLSTLGGASNLGRQKQADSTNAAQRGGVLRQAQAKEKARLAERDAMLRQAQAKEKTRLAEREQDYKRSQDGLELAHKRRLEHALAQKKSSSPKFSAYKQYVDPDGNLRQVTVSDGQTLVQGEDGSLTPQSIKGWKEYEKPTSSGSGGGFGKSALAKNIGDENKRMIGVVDTLNRFTSDYAGTGVPFVDDAKQALARESSVLATDEMKDSQNWWSDYKGYYENILRNELFGSALTESEAKEWRKANINPSMTQDQIQTKLDNQKRLMRTMIDQRKNEAKANGASQEWVDQVYGTLDTYFDEPESNEMGDGWSIQEVN